MSDLVERWNKYQHGDVISDRFIVRDTIDELERLQSRIELLGGELADANNSFGSQTANWPGLAGRIEDLKASSNQQWRRIERLQSRIELQDGLVTDLNEELSACKLHYGKLQSRIELLEAVVEEISTSPLTDEHARMLARQALAAAEDKP